MTNNIKTLSTQAAPWSKEVAWWLIVVEGGIALVFGLFALFRPEEANARFIQAIGLYLVATSALALYRQVTHKDESPGTPGRWVLVGIGFVVGLIALLHLRIATIDTAAATTVLAIGMSLLGLLGLYGVFATRAQTGIRWGAVITNLLFLLFAFAVFSHNRSEAETSGNLVWWVGILSTGAGALLILYGLKRRAATAAVATVATTAAEGPAVAQTEPVTGDQPSQEMANAPQVATETAAMSSIPAKAPQNGAG